MRHLGVLGLLSIALTGCQCGPSLSGGCDATNCLQAMGADAGALAQCLPGSWNNDGPPSSCAPIPCRIDGGGPPECARSDCGKRSFIVFIAAASSNATGVAYQGSYVAAESTKTWSSIVPPTQLPYAVENGQLLWPADSGTQTEEASCTAQELVLGGFVLRTRADAGVSNSLEALVIDGGVWTGLPYP